MMGIAPRSLVYPVKAFDHNGSASVSDIILGIDWCIRNRMHIINMSFGMKNNSVSLQNIINKAHGAGIIVVASSGNDKKSRSIDYPARYSNTISVGATGKEGRIASFSNHGPHIDIYAPGEKVNSCWLGGGYREMNGTSMATSHVSGAIALLLAHRPDLKLTEIKRRLHRTARPIPANASKIKINAGEVNALRLVRGKSRSRTS
jgi:subtilisin family serine protease